MTAVSKKRSNNKRQKILDAALEVVETNGSNHLTIDAVAAQAGFSKGGVLYHFESKHALLAGMMQHLLDANQGRLEQAAESGKDMLCAMIDAEQGMTEKERRASLAMLAVLAENAELMAPAREYMKSIHATIRAESEGDADATLLFLANEGLRFLDVLGLNPMKSAELKRIRSDLQARAAGLAS